MTIIKLDASAVAVLFPEGSEQRVELQKAVVAEFAKKAFSARSGLDQNSIYDIVHTSLEQYHNTLRTAIGEAARKVQVEALKNAGYVSETESGSYWSKVKTVKLSSSMEQEVKQLAVSTFNDKIKSTIEEQLSKNIELQLSHNPYWKRLIENKIEEALNSEIIKQVQAALKTKE